MNRTVVKKARSLQVITRSPTSPEHCSTASLRSYGRNSEDNMFDRRHQATNSCRAVQRLSRTTSLSSSRSLSKESGIVPGSVVNYSVTTSRTYTSLVPSVLTSNDGGHWISEHHETVTMCSEMTCDLDLDLDLDLRPPSRSSFRSSDVDNEDRHHDAGLTSVGHETRVIESLRRDPKPGVAPRRIRPSEIPGESGEFLPARVPCRSQHSDKLKSRTAAARGRVGVARRSRMSTADSADQVANGRKVVAVTKKDIVVRRQSDAISVGRTALSQYSTRPPRRLPVPTRSSELRLAMHSPVRCHEKRSTTDTRQCVHNKSLSDKDRGHRKKTVVKRMCQTQQQRIQQHDTGVGSVEMSPAVGLKSRRKWGFPVALFKYADDCDKSDAVDPCTNRTGRTSSTSQSTATSDYISPQYDPFHTLPMTSFPTGCSNTFNASPTNSNDELSTAVSMSQSSTPRTFIVGKSDDAPQTANHNTWRGQERSKRVGSSNYSVIHSKSPQRSVKGQLNMRDERSSRRTRLQIQTTSASASHRISSTQTQTKLNHQTKRRTIPSHGRQSVEKTSSLPKSAVSRVPVGSSSKGAAHLRARTRTVKPPCCQTLVQPTSSNGVSVRPQCVPSQHVTRSGSPSRSSSMRSTPSVRSVHSASPTVRLHADSHVLSYARKSAAVADPMESSCSPKRRLALITGSRPTSPSTSPGTRSPASIRSVSSASPTFGRHAKPIRCNDAALASSVVNGNRQRTEKAADHRDVDPRNDVTADGDRCFLTLSVPPRSYRYSKLHRRALDALVPDCLRQLPVRWAWRSEVSVD